MAHTGFYALCCICAEWRRTISSLEEKHASGDQRFYWEVEALKQVPLFDGTMCVRERAFMDQITCNFAPSQPPSLKMVRKWSHCA